MTVTDYIEVGIAVVLMIPLLREAFSNKGG
jgi:hypothetical protein